MMRNPADLIQSSFRGLVPVAMAVCLSFAGSLSAQENKPAGPAVTPPVQNPVPPPETNPDVTQYELILSQEEKAVTDKLAQASSFLQGEDYEKCLEELRAADELIRKFNNEKPNTKRAVLLEKKAVLEKQCFRSYAEKIYAQSRDTYLNVLSNRDIKSAAEQSRNTAKQLLSAKFMYYMGVRGGDVTKLQEMIRSNPELDFAKRADALIASCNKIVKYADLESGTSLENIDPGYEKRQRDIQVYYREAEQLYRERRFTQARDKVEQILILDPCNDRAAQLLARIYKKLYSIADMRQYNELLHDQAVVEWRWMENVPREQALRPDDSPREYTENNSPLYDKAQSLIIPSVEFNNMAVLDAVDFLRRKSKEIDPDRNGVQIMMQGLSKLKGSENIGTVTFALQNIPLLEAIRYLCLNVGLKYRINEKRQVIVIGPEDEIAKGDTKDKIYIPIRSATVNRMINYKRETNNEKSDSDSKEFNVDEGLGTSVEETFSEGVGAAMSKRKKVPDYSTEIRKYFEGLGFKFPAGTFIAYDSSKNRLVVQHTPEKLRQLELLIREIDIDTPLVLMEAKLMEISMNDMEELGFDWTLTHESVNPNWSFAISSPIRSALGSSNKLINNMNILPNFGAGEAWNLFLTVNAIDRTDRTEVLSTPKLMAKNGEQATIRMVREMYFPEEWEEAEVGTSCGSSVSIEPSIPSFGDATDVGVIFKAMPVVSPNNYTITLTLAPEVVDLVGWSDYSYEIIIGNFGSETANGSNNSSGSNTTSNKMTLKMPNLSHRAVETNVKVYDGQTVVIGGMIRDVQSRRDDQFPILGDVPILGRLFTNDATVIERDNLLISVTSRLISGDGTPLRANTTNGLPDFRR